MKNLINKRVFVFCIVAIIGVFQSCSSNDDKAELPNIVNANMNDLYKGSFVSVAHQTSGNVSVNQNKTTLSFANFVTDNGPNLDIYLVADINNVNSNFLNLGDIKGINGNYSYSLPSNVDFSVYKYVVVWCTDFSVNFGYATLIQQ
jgi:hypothetical protein